MNDRAPLFTPRDALEVATEARRAIARRPVAARAATHTSLHSTHNRTSQHSAYGEHNAQIAPTPAAHSPRAIENLAWPSSFDDWMIDIVRRRALRLNSGARRRGALGSVRAVELGHILDNSKDEKGRWLCAICDTPVTLQDLSFDHIVALADGGEHAAHNLAPAHRKCNEIKGSEKAQYRAKALDRWLSEWATTHEGALPKGATRYPSHGPVTPTDEERRYA